MIEIRHPSELNSWQTFRQAKGLLKHTNRASNPDWYAEAHQLDRQWHIWLDGVNVVSAVFDRKSGQWFEGPPPIFPNSQRSDAEVAFDDSEIRGLHENLHLMIQGKELGGKARSLGVMIHLADEFAISELAPEFSVDEEFAEVSELLMADPAEALGDDSVDRIGNSWRLLPYWGMQEGERRSVAVQMSRHLQPLIDELQNYGEARNIPVVVAGVSAPLEALRLAPLLLDPNEDNRCGNIFVFQYRRFSAMAVINESGDLVQMRALQHRPNQEYPSGLGEILVNTSASVNLADPQVHLVAMNQISQEPLTEELAQFFATNAPMNIGLVSPGEIEGLGSLPGGCIEMAIGDGARVRRLEANAPLADSQSFTELAGGWATQNFYGLSDEEKSFYPSQKDLKLLKLFGMGKLAMILAVVGLAGWTGFDSFRKMTTDAWKLATGTADQTVSSLNALEDENAKIKHWENLMARRSEGWLALELLLELFPSSSGLIVTECDYNVNSETGGDRRGGDQMAFSRKWVIKGHARPEGVGLLSKLGSSTFLKEHFTKLAEQYGARSMRTDMDTRLLDARIQQRQGQLPVSQRFPAHFARHYRTSFELTITQSFNDRDELALNIKPPVAEKSNNS